MSLLATRAPDPPVRRLQVRRCQAGPRLDVQNYVTAHFPPLPTEQRLSEDAIQRRRALCKSWPESKSDDNALLTEIVKLTSPKAREAFLNVQANPNLKGPTDFANEFVSELHKNGTINNVLRDRLLQCGSLRNKTEEVKNANGTVERRIVKPVFKDKASFVLFGTNMFHNTMFPLVYEDLGYSHVGSSGKKENEDATWPTPTRDWKATIKRVAELIRDGFDFAQPGNKAKMKKGKRPNSSPPTLKAKGVANNGGALRINEGGRGDDPESSDSDADNQPPDKNGHRGANDHEAGGSGEPHHEAGMAKEARDPKAKTKCADEIMREYKLTQHELPKNMTPDPTETLCVATFPSRDGVLVCEQENQDFLIQVLSGTLDVKVEAGQVAKLGSSAWLLFFEIKSGMFIGCVETETESELWSFALHFAESMLRPMRQMRQIIADTVFNHLRTYYPMNQEDKAVIEWQMEHDLYLTGAGIGQMRQFLKTKVGAFKGTLVAQYGGEGDGFPEQAFLHGSAAGINALGDDDDKYDMYEMGYCIAAFPAREDEKGAPVLLCTPDTHPFLTNVVAKADSNINENMPIQSVDNLEYGCRAWLLFFKCDPENDRCGLLCAIATNNGEIISEHYNKSGTKEMRAGMALTNLVHGSVRGYYRTFCRDEAVAPGRNPGEKKRRLRARLTDAPADFVARWSAVAAAAS